MAQLTLQVAPIPVAAEAVVQVAEETEAMQEYQVLRDTGGTGGVIGSGSSAGGNGATGTTTAGTGTSATALGGGGAGTLMHLGGTRRGGIMVIEDRLYLHGAVTLHHPRQADHPQLSRLHRGLQI